MRQPKPYWKTSHKCWYVKIRNRHIRLDPDKALASGRPGTSKWPGFGILVRRPRFLS